MLCCHPKPPRGQLFSGVEDSLVPRGTGLRKIDWNKFDLDHLDARGASCIHKPRPRIYGPDSHEALHH